MRISLFILSLSMLTVQTVRPQDVDTINRRAEQIVSALTLDEKLEMLRGDWSPYDRGVHDLYGGGNEKYGIQPFSIAFGTNGIRTNGKSTLYPCPLAVAAARDTVLAERLGRSLARDAKARGYNVLAAPSLNLFTDTTDENHSVNTFGTDPGLAARLAVAMIRGIHSEGVMAAPVYFYSDGGDIVRENEYISSVIAQARPGAILIGGERDGVRIVEDDGFNIGFVRSESGFDGMVIAMPREVRDGERSLRAGVNIDLPKGEFMNPDELRQSVDHGNLSPDELDLRVYEIISTMLRFGLDKGHSPDLSIPENDPLSVSLAKEIAFRSQVVLKNEGMIPFGANERVVVLGNGLYKTPSPRGLNSVRPFREVSVYDVLNAVRPDYIFIPRPTETIDLNMSGEFFCPGTDTPGVVADFYGDRNFRGGIALQRVERAIDYGWEDHVPTLEHRPYDFSCRWYVVYKPLDTGITKFTVSGAGTISLNVDDVEVARVESDKDIGSSGTHTFFVEQGREYLVQIEYRTADHGADVLFTYESIPCENLSGLLAGADKIILVIADAGNTVLSEEIEFWINAVEPYSNKVMTIWQGCRLPDPLTVDNYAGFMMSFYPGQEGGTAIVDILTGAVKAVGRLPFPTELNFNDGPTDQNLKRKAGKKNK